MFSCDSENWTGSAGRGGRGYPGRGKCQGYPSLLPPLAGFWKFGFGGKMGRMARTALTMARARTRKARRCFMICKGIVVSCACLVDWSLTILHWRTAVSRVDSALVYIGFASCTLDAFDASSDQQWRQLCPSIGFTSNAHSLATLRQIMAPNGHKPGDCAIEPDLTLIYILNSSFNTGKYSA